ncbi:MAG: YbaB/EbfC family nucleoid-associated protein [Alphaproteobacteria bacterium CG_4_10_14_0_8_um_filter_53_9]|nr:MAG: YbaB/EbfC family nucleoid-associated protein [Alphaproteobacteria bacterium CG_4_10_14_0_8_um_filter_53_9]
MKDMFGMMKKAQEMQRKMGEVQKELAVTEVVGESSGLVKVTMTGTHEVRRVDIDPKALEDVEMLGDLMVVACNDALKKANAMAEEKMKPVTGGLNLPGMGM